MINPFGTKQGSLADREVESSQNLGKTCPAAWHCFLNNMSRDNGVNWVWLDIRMIPFQGFLLGSFFAFYMQSLWCLVRPKPDKQTLWLIFWSISILLFFFFKPKSFKLDWILIFSVRIIIKQLGLHLSIWWHFWEFLPYSHVHCTIFVLIGLLWHNVLIVQCSAAIFALIVVSRCDTCISLCVLHKCLASVW